MLGDYMQAHELLSVPLLGTNYKIINVILSVYL